MDRSFLSQPDVVAASRRFVCVRLATYESQKEAELLKSIFIGRSGELENTVFTILSPDGDKKLVRAGRSPHHTFFGPPDDAAADMVATMHRIADQYRAQPTTKTQDLDLPNLANLRIALNVAACDNQPLLITLGRDDKEVDQLERRLRPLAWSDEFIGQFAYAAVSDRGELEPLETVQLQSGYVVVQPGKFGLRGEILVQLPHDASPEMLSEGLNLGITLHQRHAKETRSHIAAGREQGVHWKTAIPVTDPGPRGGRPAPPFQRP